jgi:hypothetical protein
VSFLVFSVASLINYFPRLERLLNLARNPALDSIDDNAFAEKQLKLANSYQLHCTDAQAVATNEAIRVNRNHERKIVQQSLTASGQAATFVDQISTRMDKPELAKTTLDHRSQRESATAKCDAIAVVPISGFLDKIAKVVHSDVDLKDHFILVMHPTPEPGANNPESNIVQDDSASSTGKGQEKSRKKSAVSQTASSSSLSQLLQPDASSSRVSSSKQTTKAQLQDVFAVSEYTLQTKEAPTGDNLSAPRDNDGDILLPLLTAEYKRADQTGSMKALNQTRLYTTASLTFLQSVGIMDQPVFGLITSGTCGAVCLCWFSSKHDVRAIPSHHPLYLILSNRKCFLLSEIYAHSTSRNHLAHSTSQLFFVSLLTIVPSFKFDLQRLRKHSTVALKKVMACHGRKQPSTRRLRRPRMLRTRRDGWCVYL